VLIGLDIDVEKLSGVVCPAFGDQSAEFL